MKPFHVLISALIFSLFMFSGLSYLGGKVTAEQLPRWSFEHRNLDWQGRYSAYQQSPDTPQTIIVGQSYAAQLGDFENVRNLGFPGGNPQMCKEIIKRIRPCDTVLFIITARDIIFQGVESPLKFNRATAQIASVKRLLIPVASTPREIRAAQRVGLIRLWLSMPYDISLYKEIHGQYPNVRFMLFPCCPEKLDISACDARRLAFNNRVIATLFKQADIPLIDLSRSLSASDFKNFLHANERGKRILRAHIASL